MIGHFKLIREQGIGIREQEVTSSEPLRGPPSCPGPSGPPFAENQPKGRFSGRSWPQGEG